ncbi:MAG: L,D-transpeptidase [Sorangiineae bacterium]|nr:L,D-transpeptidase [Polyangiaceae bacterium]MEB2324892.1 L,D-transpeptidase [Sorangiineae bacterium]
MASRLYAASTLLALWLGLGCSKQDTPSASKPSAAPGERETASSAQAAGAQPAAAPEAERSKTPPLVDLAGRSHPLSLAVVDPGRPRIASRALRTWVHERPSLGAPKLGYLRAGASSPTSAEPAGFDGCKGGWYPVEPRGYVCAGARATLDLEDPVVRATRELQPDPLRKLPYIYGTVRRPGPTYAKLPSRAELERVEPGIDERMQQWLGAEGEVGASYAQDVWLGGRGAPPDPAEAWKTERSDPLPWFLENGGSTPNLYRKARPEGLVIDEMRAKVGYSFLETFLWQGRRYGLSTDLRLLPTDRLRPIQGSEFHGWQIPEEIDFPFVIVRRDGAHAWLYDAAKNRLIDAGTAPYRAAFKLTGKQKFFRSVLHYETVEGKWLSDRDASRLDPPRRMPAWGKNGEKWMDINITKQTLVLYEGERAVYATLVSTGEAGLDDPKRSTATKRGIFRIHTKHLATTMSSNETGEEFELRDVPYVQYFDQEGYALHGAYWHDRFGVPKSHGCINLAPEDARRVFFWTEPSLPTGWHGVLLPLKGTVMFVHP